MKVTAIELTRLCDERNFKAILSLWEGGLVSSDSNTLYQVYIAASILAEDAAAATIMPQLPEEMRHDARRDWLLMELRSGRLTYSPSLQKEVLSLSDDAPDRDRLAVAKMLTARMLRAMGGHKTAQELIKEAAWLILFSDEEQWRRNIAFWYLVIGGSKAHRRELLSYLMDDTNPRRKLIGYLCYRIPVAGRVLPMR